MSQNFILLLVFFNHLRNGKIILSLQAIQKQAVGWIWPMGYSLLTPCYMLIFCFSSPISPSSFKKSKIVCYPTVDTKESLNKYLPAEINLKYLLRACHTHVPISVIQTKDIQL